MNRLDQFLNTAARQMRIMPAAKRDDELRELRGHLEQRAEDYIGAGMSDDAAQMRALEGLGSPRALGAKLCDAWEGIPFSWWRVLAAIAGVTVFFGIGVTVIVLALLTITSTSEIALLPEISPLFCAFYLALPLSCGVLFSHWLGRRGCLVATFYFAIFRLNPGYPSAQSTFSPPADFVALTSATWFPYLLVALAFAGAWRGQRWRLQKRCQLALVGGHIKAPVRILWIPFNLNWWRNVLLFVMLTSALYAARVWLQFHPKTPEATLENHLLTASPEGFDTPEILELRALPPANSAERAGTERRVYFRVAAHAKPYFAANQIKYLQGTFQNQARTNGGSSPANKALLARVKNNRQIIKGTATMVKTPTGWKRDYKSFGEVVVLWKWFYY